MLSILRILVQSFQIKQNDSSHLAMNKRSNDEFVFVVLNFMCTVDLKYITKSKATNASLYDSTTVIKVSFNESDQS